MGEWTGLPNIRESEREEEREERELERVRGERWDRENPDIFILHSQKNFLSGAQRAHQLVGPFLRHFRR